MLERQEAWDLHVQRVAIANQAIEDLTGKRVEMLTAGDLMDAKVALDIDLTYGTFRVPLSASKPKERAQLMGRRRPADLVLTGAGDALVEDRGR